jgi:hypothetical protein
MAYYVGEATAQVALNRLFPQLPPKKHRFQLANVVGLVAKPEEIEIVGGTIVLRTEGEYFCGAARQDQARLARLGSAVYHRFVEVADTLNAVYGAILVEYSLEEPSELAHTQDSLAFQDFYLGTSSFDPATIGQVLEIAGKDAFVEKRLAGFYVGMPADFRPDGRGLPSDEAQRRSARIGAVVGASLSLKEP